MRKALVVGVDHYQHLSGLNGCVNDAYSVKTILERHSDGSINFDVEILTSAGPGQPIVRSALKQKIRELFTDDPDIAFLYFAGHGYAELTGGYLLPSDSQTGDDGIPLAEVMTMANGSGAKNRIIVLDSCQSGSVGTHPATTSMAEIKEGTTLLTASTATQYAVENGGSGLFTSLFVDALSGAAANLVGDITPGSVYAHIDQSLGSWGQRPMFKTNIKKFVSIRRVQPPIDIQDLRRLVEFFPTPGAAFSLDPSYEPERSPSDAHLPAPNPENTAKFKILQNLVRVNLVVPVDAPHMWHAAMNSKSCRLTVLGEHYRTLVALNRI